MKLAIKVVPGSSRDCIAGWLGETLKVRVRAKAEHGKANAAVAKLLADTLDLPKHGIQMIGGLTSARKVIQIDGLSQSEVYQRLTKMGP